MLDLIDKVKIDDYKDNDFVSFGLISDAVATHIFNVMGIDVCGYELKIEARQVYHILKDHSITGAEDSSMKNDADIARMEFVLREPDNIVPAGKTQAYSYMRDGHNRTADTVLYTKQISKDKAYYIVQALPVTKKKAVYVVTAFIGKEGYKKETPQLTNAQSPSATPENGSAEVSATIIPDSSQKSNPLAKIPSLSVSP